MVARVDTCANGQHRLDMTLAGSTRPALLNHPDDPTGPVWTDKASDVSRPDRSGADQIDVEHQPRDLAIVGGSCQSRCQSTSQHQTGLWRPSSSSVVSCGVKMLELDAGVLGREPPVDTATGAVACRLPG